MVQHQGIDVYLAPFGNIEGRYQEYAVPVDSPVFTGDPNEVWIEAVEGERFVIVVDLLKDFDAKGSKALWISRDVGGNRGIASSQSYLALERNLRNLPAGTGLKGHYSSKTEVRKVDGRWAMCGYTFAQLKMDEEMDMDQAQIQKAIVTLGKITVNVQRGQEKNLPARCKPTSSAGYDRPDTELSSKGVVKDNHVSHAIGHVVLGEATQPEAYSNEEWKGLAGAGGKTLNFTIRYRSRDVLQRLKIVPRDKVHTDLTDSPPPSPKVKREIKDDVIKHEAAKRSCTGRNIKLEPVNDGSLGKAGAPPSNTTPADNPDDAGTSDEHFKKKRKALQGELREVELEQKRLRLTKALAEMDGDGK